jgi:subtilisin
LQILKVFSIWKKTNKQHTAHLKTGDLEIIKKIAVSFMLISVICMSLVTVGSVSAQPTEEVPVIISFKGAPDANLVKAFGGTIKYEYTIIPGIAASLPVQAIDALQRNPNIAAIEFDGVAHATEDYQWGITQIGANIVHQNGNTGRNIKVAILDTGIDYKHPDLDTNFDTLHGYDFVNNDADPMDDNGHGAQ